MLYCYHQSMGVDDFCCIDNHVGEDNENGLPAILKDAGYDNVQRKND